MGSFGPEGGPPCERCHQLPSVYHSDAYGLMCYRCLQDDDNMCWASYLNFKYRTNPWLNRYCQCGECDPNWFLRGWVCYDVPQQDWSGQPVADHHIITFVYPALHQQYSSQRWLTFVKDFVLWPRDCELARVHDDSTAFVSSYALHCKSHSILVHSHGVSRQRCRGH